MLPWLQVAVKIGLMPVCYSNLFDSQNFCLCKKNMGCIELKIQGRWRILNRLDLKRKQEIQPSLTIRTTHLCKCNGADDPRKRGPPMCHHSELGWDHLRWVVSTKIMQLNEFEYHFACRRIRAFICFIIMSPGKMIFAVLELWLSPLQWVLNW